MGALASILVAVALTFIYAAQNIWVAGGESTTTHSVVLWTGLAALAAGSVVRFLDWNGASGLRRTAETRVGLAHVGLVASLGLYALQSEWGITALKLADDSKVPTLLAVLWPALFTVSALALVFMELVYRRMPVAEGIEIRRLSAAAFDGVSIALAIVFAVSVNYAADKGDIRKDVSYFKTTKPSETSLRLVKSVNEPIRAVLFFPKTNEVLTEVTPYFKALAKANPKFRVDVMDHALAPALASAHKVKDNGAVLLLKGADGHGQQGEQIDIGTDLAIARSRLRTLDGRFQQTFTTLARQKREISFVVGHDERSDASARETPVPERTSEFVKALDRANVRMKDLGINQGLASRVPAGVPMVALVGPRRPLLPEEAESLLRYVKDGGRLLVMVDPQDDSGAAPLLEGLGLELEPGVLTSDANFIPRTHTDADRSLVYTKKFSSHPTVTIASRHASQLAVAFVAGGALARKEGAGPKDAKVLFPIRTEGSYWLDTNQNYALDGDEKRGVKNMMAVVTIPVAGSGAEPAGSEEKKEGRAVVIADADFATDQVIGNPGNVVVINDILQWLLGEEQIVGEVTSEEDVPIEHTRQEDKLWFYGTTLGAPLPLFGLGIWVAIRRRRRRRTSQPKEGAGS
ncbi:MAG: Gldg family protein [Polyangiales bacterium]